MSHLPHAHAFVPLALLAGPALAEDRWATIPHWGPMPEPASSGMAEVNGISMYYATFGQGDPVLLIHGSMANSNTWSAQVADLMKDHLVIVADSRGQGRSTHDDRPYSYDLMADDYVALLDFLEIPKVDIVGASAGGIIGLDIAMRHPERLDDLFAQGVNVTPEGLSFDAPPSDAVLAALGWITDDYKALSPTPDEFDATFAQMSALDEREPNWPDEELAKITAPVTLALGDHDEIISRAQNEHVAEVIPNAKLVILPDVSHFANLQAPEEYVAAVREAIDD